MVWEIMESEKQAESRAFPLVEPEEGIFETYANVVDADWTLTDVTLRFLHLVHISKEEGATTLNREMAYMEKANITLPWWQAKVLVSTLGGLVASYEAANGELKQPTLAERPSEPTPKRQE
jgi:hypothetical protein